MERLNPEGPSYSATPTTVATAAPSEPRGWIFPFQPLWILGQVVPSVYATIPSQFRIVRSLPHLVQLLGIITNVFLLVRAAEESTHWRDRDTAYLVVLISSGLFALFCFWQLFCELAQYRHDLQRRALQVEESKEELVLQFDASARELEELLARSTNTEAGLAERNLDSERRDFHRFLKSMSPKLSGQPALDEPYNSFIKTWLQILAECSADPVGRPFTVIGEAELCLGARELTEQLLERLKASEIRFIKDNVDEGRKGILNIKTAWSKMMLVQRKALKFTGLSRFVKRSDEEEGVRVSKSQSEVLEMPCMPEGEKLEPFWFKFQLGAGCGLESGADERFPLRLRCMLFIFIVLSPEHLSLMLSFFFCLSLVILNACLSDPSHVIITSLLVSLSCLTFVLYDFLDIDSVQRLEQQIAEMKVTARRVDQQRQDLQAFFARVHLLMALWQMRTLPRLEMLKQLGILVDDESNESELVPLLTEIVQKMLALERTMLPLPLWQEDRLSPTEKYDTLQLLQPLSVCGGKEMLQRLPDATAKMRELMDRVLEA